MFPISSRLYPLTDVGLTGLSHAEQVRRLIAGGARLIQLREKHLPPDQFFEQAQEALNIARSHGVKIIINDRVDIALALGADGVHLGQEDLPPEAARSLLGMSAIIGFSTHNLEQAQLAATCPVDYVAFGPIFSTTSKLNPDPPLGLKKLREVRNVLEGKPLVAIGGITAQNAREVLKSGADHVAIIHELLGDPDAITDATRHLTALIDS